MNKIFHPNIDELYVGFADCPRAVLTLVQKRLGLPGRDQPDLVTHVRFVFPVLHAPLPDTPRLHLTFAPPLTRPELINIFEIFLPQLLRYPNPSDPLNGEAAALLMRDPAAYARKVETYVDRFATPEDADQAGDEDEDEDETDDAGPSRPKKLELGRRQGSSSAADAGAGAGSGLGTSAGNGRVGANGLPSGNGSGHANGNGAAKNGGNGHVKNGDGKDGDDEQEEDEDDEDDKMSDMGELSDGDEFMGEMDD